MGAMVASGGPYGFTVNPYLTFVKDYWFPFAAFLGAVAFIVRGCVKIVKNSSRVHLIEADIDDLRRDVLYIRGKVSAIEKFLKSYFGGGVQFSTGLVQVRSPLKLSKSGLKLLNDCGFKEIYRKNKPKFLEMAASHRPKMKYEAQEAALAIMMELTENEMLSPLKKFAFARGKNLMDIIRVCGIYLRDELIKEMSLKE